VAYFVLRNTPKNGGEKEAGKGGAEFPPQTIFPPCLPCGAGLGMGSVSAILRLAPKSCFATTGQAQYQNRKIFFSF